MTDRFAPLLDRTPHRILDDLVRPVVTGKRVLVTGAGGSIGSEIAKIAAHYDPASLVLMERSEPALFRIARHLDHAGFKCHKPLLADVGIVADCNSAIRTHKPDVVFHAAAHKHVPLMQDHPAQAVRNNVLGTLNIAKAAENVPSLVLVSTDKAVHPAGVMGQTKRLAEMIVQQVPRWSIVRFGNVIGSSGSVLETWEAQVDANVPMTVTDPAMTRYLMSVGEAAGLVLQCGSFGGGGYVLDMGVPVNILDLAHRYAASVGGWPVIITGVRAGEKMHEELWYTTETLYQTRHPGILQFEPMPEPAIATMIVDLKKSGAAERDIAARTFLARWGSARQVAA